MSTNNTKQAAWIAVGSLFSYGFGIVSSMILSRYFGKGDYGTYKQVIYVYHTLLTVFTLGLPRAYSYFIPRVPLNQVKSLINKITNIFFILGTVFSLVLFFGSGVIADILKNPDLEKALKIFAIVPILMLPTMGLEGILATFKKTKFMAVYTIVTRVIKLICVATPVIFFHGGYIEALIGFVVSDMIAFAFAMYLKNMPVRNAGRERCIITIKEIFAFSLPLLYASLWAIIINSADQFFISRYFGTVVFAEFSNGSIDMPFVGMIVTACSAVLSPIFSRMNYEQLNPHTEIFPLWKSCLTKSALVIWPLVVFCMFFADDIMVFLYSAKYVDSDNYFRIRLITNFFKVIAYAPLVINIGQVKFYSRIHMVVAFLIVILEFVAVKLFSSPYAVSVVSVICNLTLIFSFLIFIANYFRVGFLEMFPVKDLLILLIASTAVGIMVRIVFIHIDLHRYVKLAMETAVFGVLFFGVSYFLKFNYLQIVQSLIKK